MNNRKRKLCALVCTGILMLATGCAFGGKDTAYQDVAQGTKSFTEKEVLSAKNVLHAVSTISVNETGIYYYDSRKRLCYYDYQTKDKYVLCSAPGCNHDTDECNAYMGENKVYGGYAMYGDHIYIWYQPSDSSYLELAKMNSVGQSKKVITEIYAGEKPDEWRLQYLNEIYYFQGYAFAELHWIKNETTNLGFETTLEGSQLIAVNLEDGTVIDLTGILQYEKDVLKLAFTLFSDQDIVYVRESFKDSILSEDEYYMNNLEGDYAFYYDEFWTDTPQKGECWVFSVDTQENELIWKGDSEFYTDVTTGESYYKPPFYFCGSVDGRWLTFRYDNQMVEYAWFDMDTGNLESLWTLNRNEEKSSLGSFYGDWYYNLVYDGGKLLCREKLKQGQERIFWFNLLTKQEEEIYISEDDEYALQNYLFMEETSDRMIAKGNGKDTYFIVKKSDFEVNGMKRATEIDL